MAAPNNRINVKLKLKISNAFQLKVDQLPTGYTEHPFCSRDLDLDTITLVYERDLDIPKMCLHTKNERTKSRLSKCRVRTGHRHTFCSFNLDLDLDPMTLIYERDLKILKMYLRPSIYRSRDPAKMIFL